MKEFDLFDIPIDEVANYRNDNGDFLQQTTVGMFPILYMYEGMFNCADCAPKLTHIQEVGIFIGGPDLVCDSCGRTIHSLEVS